ncbi:MAG: AraC family transcriptional regulator [Clostridia bacterium]|nr:AraC family transcriptional regulator [Clostridia bacterium]
MYYTERLMEAIYYIEKNLTKKITLQDISRQIYISPFHFHEIFAYATGGTLGEYIRKRRLTEAAKKLVDTTMPIIDIALDYGYDSHEAFTRAFKNQFGITPSKYRQRRKHNLFSYRLPVEEKDLHYYQSGGITLTPQIVQKEPIRIVGICGQTSIQENRTDLLWLKFTERMNEIRGIEGRGYYSICRYSPEVEVRDILEDFTYTAFLGLEVENFEHVPSGMETHVIPGGSYAVFSHKGNTSVAMETYRYIFGEWYPNTPYRLNGNFDFEYYRERYIYGVDMEELELDIHIPVR